jgi:hypothetical protein
MTDEDMSTAETVAPATSTTDSIPSEEEVRAGCVARVGSESEGAGLGATRRSRRDIETKDPPIATRSLTVVLRALGRHHSRALMLERLAYVAMEEFLGLEGRPPTKLLKLPNGAKFTVESDDATRAEHGPLPHGPRRALQAAADRGRWCSHRPGGGRCCGKGCSHRSPRPAGRMHGRQSSAQSWIIFGDGEERHNRRQASRGHRRVGQGHRWRERAGKVAVRPRRFRLASETAEGSRWSRRMTNEGPVGTIVGGPTPDEQGMVSFKVQLGNEIVIGVANPCGSGLREDFAGVNADVATAVMRVVSQFVEEHSDEMPRLYREAARLRRAAGNAPIFGNLRRGRFAVVGAPVKLGEAGARFTTQAGEIRLTVVVSKGGGFDVIELYDDFKDVSNDDQSEAVTVCFDHIFAHPCRHRSLGVPFSPRSPVPGSRRSGLQLEFLEPLTHQHSGLRVVMRMHAYDIDSAAKELGGALPLASCLGNHG